MQNEIKFTLPPKLMGKVFWQESIISTGGPMIFLGIMVIYILWMTHIIGGNLWWGGFFSGCFVFGLAVWISGFFRTMNAAKLYQDVLRTMVFHDEYITQTGPDNVCNVNWSIYKRIRIRKNAWIFYTGSNNYYVVPSECIDDELGSYIIRKIQENKGMIRKG